MNQQPVSVAIAILFRQGCFLMQLRDNIPTIFYPGYWGLFGGHLELGETPEIAVKRELKEEIGYCPPVLSKFGCYTSPEVIRHVYYGSLEVDLQQLVLGEGWDLGLLTPEEIQRGDRFSQKAGEVRPLGTPHQQIMLDFIAKQTSLGLCNY